LLDNDLVLVLKLPLAAALKRHLDEPYVGKFATTPHQLVRTFEAAAEDRRAFLERIEETDHDWKAASYAIGNVAVEGYGTDEAVLKHVATDPIIAMKSHA